MMIKRKRAGIELPRHVHRVIARAREYFFYQTGRNTRHQGPRIPLPKDPQSPEFWEALRRCQGVAGASPDTFNALADAYILAAENGTLPRKLAKSTISTYRKMLRRARKAWGELPARGLKPVHTRALLDKLASTPGVA